jgi:hypothetical protein
MNKQRVIKFLEDIEWLFAIQNFDRQLTFKKTEDGEKAAEITFDERYQNIKVKIFPCFWEEKVEDQRKILLHELCHSITLPSKTMFYHFLDGEETFTKTQADEINEKATSKIENILDGLLRGRMAYARRAYADYVKVKKKKKKKIK